MSISFRGAEARFGRESRCVVRRRGVGTAWGNISGEVLGTTVCGYTKMSNRDRAMGAGDGGGAGVVRGVGLCILIRCNAGREQNSSRELWWVEEVVTEGRTPENMVVIGCHSFYGLDNS